MSHILKTKLDKTTKKMSNGVYIVLEEKRGFNQV